MVFGSSDPICDGMHIFCGHCYSVKIRLVNAWNVWNVVWKIRVGGMLIARGWESPREQRTQNGLTTSGQRHSRHDEYSRIAAKADEVI